MQPNMIKIRRHFKAPVIEHIEFAIQEELSKIEIRSRIKPGMRIAITAGSRGIANIARIITGVVTELKRHGAEPFIVPAMGSHGGATAEGQIARITEKTLVVGADIAKKIHVARAVDFRGIELGKDCVFQNDQEGLTKLASWMKELGRVHEKTALYLALSLLDTTGSR